VRLVSPFDPFSAETLADPGAGWSALLRDDPVPFVSHFDPPFYTLTRHADVSAALRDVETWSSSFGQGPRFTQQGGLLSDPPEHTRFRRIVQRAFTPGRVEKLRPHIQEIANELLDAADDERLELHDDYAFPLPVIVISQMLGVPAEDRHDFKRWSDRAVEALGMEDPTPLLGELRGLASYLLRAVRSHRDEPRGGDLIDQLLATPEDGAALSDDQVVGVVSQLLVGGNETTTSLITNALWRLLEDRERWEALRAEPSLLPAALEESLRFDPPVLGLFRTTTCEVEVRGRTIPSGAKVMLSYAAANRDPEVFSEPDRFRLDRSPDEAKQHLSFGQGVHFCLGAALARLEAQVAVQTLLDRRPLLTLENEGTRIAPFFLWGRRRLPLRGPPRDAAG
jgi:cytochrome P450